MPANYCVFSHKDHIFGNFSFIRQTGFPEIPEIAIQMIPMCISWDHTNVILRISGILIKLNGKSENGVLYQREYKKKSK